MRGLRKIGAVLALTFAITGVAGTANAAPAEAATVIKSNCYRYYQYGWGNQLEQWQRCWVDYSWSEEVFQGKRDCYCHTEPVLYWR